ncbi:hypothetical protein [Gemmatimonas sp.]
MAERIDAVWVVRPPKTEDGIQWPVQLHREERTARYAHQQDVIGGIRSTVERLPIATPEMVTLCNAVLVYLTSLDQCDDHGYDEMIAAGRRYREVQRA